MRVCVCVCECVSVWNRFDPSRSENWWRRAGFSYLLAVCFPVTYGQVDGLAFSLSLSRRLSSFFPFPTLFLFGCFFSFSSPPSAPTGTVARSRRSNTCRLENEKKTKRTRTRTRRRTRNKRATDPFIARRNHRLEISRRPTRLSGAVLWSSVCGHVSVIQRLFIQGRE